QSEQSCTVGFTVHTEGAGTLPRRYRLLGLDTLAVVAPWNRLIGLDVLAVLFHRLTHSLPSRLDSAGRSPARLVFRSVRETFALIRLLAGGNPCHGYFPEGSSCLARAPYHDSAGAGRPGSSRALLERDALREGRPA